MHFPLIALRQPLLGSYRFRQHQYRALWSYRNVYFNQGALARQAS